jgi:hypothetical protein
MGHFFRMCGRSRPNEKFSGSRHRRHICGDCAKRPREERERIAALRNTNHYLHLRNISAKNIAHLQRLCDSADDEVRQTAALVLEVTRVRPGKRGRAGWLAKHRPDLLARLVRLGLFGELVGNLGFDAEAAAETKADSTDCEVPF